MKADNHTFHSKAAESNSRIAVHKPELLCPAGSPAAFLAAIDAGADAIYLGSSAFNARINAKNFTADEMREAIRTAHIYGVKTYIAANTMIFDREMPDFLSMAEKALEMGADALIAADLGAAAAIKRHFPKAELHASTQLSGHNVSAAEKLAALGFSRMVCAREMSKADLEKFARLSPIESEVFVHGALCVSHSGQCLFSSLVGQRSGNRGECGQPCRLPYVTKSGKKAYPLSLKDLCLAEHIVELCDMGISSFKIEGRMKSPEYVRDVTKIWRKLIDERRNASVDEMRELAEIFSRDGFTDGYYKGEIGRQMMGIRSDENKKESRERIPFSGLERKIPIELYAKIKANEPASLTVMPYNITVSGDIPDIAINAPLDEIAVRKNLSKLGGTPFESCKIEIELDKGLILPISKLNALRRTAIDKITSAAEGAEIQKSEDRPEPPQGQRYAMRSAVFYANDIITSSAKEFFDIIYTPLHLYDGECNGVLLPAVIFDSELDEVRSILRSAKQKGAEHALVGNIGHISLAQEAGLIPHGDFRLNAGNNYSVAEYEKLGFEDIVLSPELTIPRIRDIGGRSAAIVYGKIPLMVTEKCVGREISDCNTCNIGKCTLIDRKNVSFPVKREWKHRSIIFNSLPYFAADRQAELMRAGILMQHFIFSDETAKEVNKVIDCYKKGIGIDKPIRRMN